MTGSRKQELIEELREVRSGLLASTLGLTELQLSTELVIDKWSIKDILGHIGSWEEEFLKVAEKFLKEEKPQYDYLIREENNWSEWNLSQWDKKKALNYKKTLEELFEIHERFVKLMESLPEESLSLKKLGSWGNEATIEQIILSEIDHEMEHARKILEWRKSKAGIV